MRRIIVCIALALNFVSLSAQQEDKTMKDWAQFSRYEDANQDVKSPRAVLMGDSITDRWAKTDKTFFEFYDFVGRGISGQTTPQMLTRFRRNVLELKPKMVIILAGTNDIARNTGYISLENIFGNIVSMCELAKLYKIQPVLCSVLPCEKYPHRDNIEPADMIIELNEMLKNYAKKNKYIYVDYHSALKNEYNGLPAEYTKDGLHPNKECYKIMKEILLDALK